MGIFDSIKNAFGSKDEPAADVTISPSQMLRNAGLDPSGLKFGFGTGTITVSGEIADDADRQKILDILTEVPGITSVKDDMAVAAPATEPAPEPAPGSSIAEPTGAGQQENQKTYTVQSGDTLWKISREMYGDGSKYMKIFEANTGLLTNPDQIFPGQELIIPAADD